jgi:hypothetical protein
MHYYCVQGTLCIFVFDISPKYPATLGIPAFAAESSLKARRRRASQTIKDTAMTRVLDLYNIAREAIASPTPLTTTRAFDAGVEGYSGQRLIGFLQRAAAYYQDDPEVDRLAYLEIGVYRGLTLMNVAAAAPRLRCLGCDNFSQFDPSGENKGVVLSHIAKLGLQDTVGLIEMDFEQLLGDAEDTIQGRKVPVYFFDGPHDYRSQLIGLMWGRKILAEGGIMVVDDTNYAQVRQATYDFLKGNSDFTLLFEAYTAGHPHSVTPQQNQECRKTWWNGVHVVIHDPHHELTRLTPPFSPGVRKFHEGLHPSWGMVNGGHPLRGAEPVGR